jgi:hypothetical protein
MVAGGPETLASSSAGLGALIGLLEGADVTPTSQLEAAVAERHATHHRLLERAAQLEEEGKQIS